ncbi:radical S-adenosyl methionine domain-containing protein 1, mitochondrial-like [Strongylocentrotus purpuratus]|uniref:Radical S-adenosyl methionine domain-containing protein 1, mitochondrial n=1 Tax=Strongylocentrotus purpuratus TaxID=7668 RepID=A0A7M7HJN4_STRPU|nr:radical S-adenosyl methionine domain-containing protein 1, mitochondrial-like [Strongylocentrotus purpuratus]
MPLIRRLPSLSKNLSRVLLNHQRCESSTHSLATNGGHVEPRSKEDHYPLWMEEASLYVHWPYCQKRYTYCNFNKYVTPTIDQNRMRACLVREAQTLIKLSGVKQVNSIFFGGGTPSLAEPRVLEGVIEAVKELVAMPTDVEISMEANPTSVEMKKLEDFKSAGVNRLSLGIQALDSNDLKTLGREHTVGQSLTCIHEARKLFPDRLSIDIIFGRPSQTLNSWEAELEQILQVCDSHISLYQLTLEPGTLLYKFDQQGVLPMPDADLIADMYETAVERLAQAGFHRYEVSNFARTVRAESIHNKAYWEGKQYIGVGPGAHGRFVPITEQFADNADPSGKRGYSQSLPNGKRGYSQSLPNGKRGYSQSLPSHSKGHDESKERTINNRSNKNLIKLSTAAKSNNDHQSRELSVTAVTEQIGATPDGVPTLPQREARIQTLEPDTWMLEVEKYGDATRKRIPLSNVDVLRELLLTGLRTRPGISDQTWQQLSPGDCLRDVFGSSDFIKSARESGLMKLDDAGLRCTHRGLNVLDSLLPDLTDILNSHYDRQS